MKKHYKFNSEDGRGRFAVAITENGDFILRQIAGKAPPVTALFSVVKKNPKILEKGYIASANRENPFFVEKHEGMSGCATYMLRFERDAAIADYPIGGSLHVSMYGKLNEGINMWIGDLYEILNHIPIPDLEIGIEECEIFHPRRETPPTKIADHKWAHTAPLFKIVEIGCQTIKIYRASSSTDEAIEHDNILFYDGDEAPTIAIENIEKVNSAIEKYGWRIDGNILKNWE